MTKRITSFVLLCACLLTCLASCRGGNGGGGTEAPVNTTEPSYFTPEAEEETSTFRVMSFNLQTSIKGDRQEAVLSEFTHYQPDVFGLQEDNPTWNEFLGASLPEYTRISRAPSDTGELCAIYFKTEKYNLLASGSRWLSKNGAKTIALTLETMPADALQPFKDAGYTFLADNYLTQKIYDDLKTKGTNYGAMIGGARPMSWVVLEDKESGDRFIYVNTHLQHRGALHKTLATELRRVRELERIAQWNFLVEYLKNEIQPQFPGVPVILTGDLNEVSGSNSYNTYMETFDDSSRLAEVYRGTDGTWNSAYNSSYNGQVIFHETSSAGNTSRYEGVSVDAIDYCLVSPNGFRVHSFEVSSGIYEKTVTVDGADKTGYIYTSDHKALVVDLSVGVAERPMALQASGGDAPSVYRGAPDTFWYTNAPEKEGYLLTTANQLAGFFKLLGEGVNFAGKSIRLGANMVMSEDASYAVPSFGATSFAGTFDGRGYYISGADVSANGGLFGVLGNATVQNLSLINSKLAMTANTAAGGSFASSVAAGCHATLWNLYSDCSIGELESAGNCGGILGLVEAEGASLSMNYCTYAGDLAVSGNRVGGLIGALSGEALTVQITHCLATGALVGGDMTGGLIGYVKAASFTLSSSAKLGSLKATRLSGGLIGTIDVCPNLTVSFCVVKANMDYSAIGAGGTAENPVSVPAGCQVGGLIGRTYAVRGYVTDCLIAGSMKATTAIVTQLDLCHKENEPGNYKDDYNHLASGGVVGFNSQYSNSANEVADGEIGLNHLHFDTLMVTLEMIDVESYIGGTRDFPVNALSTHRLSWVRILHDDDLYAKSGAILYGWRIQKDRTLDSSGEANAQVQQGISLFQKDLIEWNPEKVKELGYYRWMYSKTLSLPVPGVEICDLLFSAAK